MKRDTRIIIGICILFLAAAGVLFWRQQSTTAVFSGEPASVQSSFLPDLDNMAEKNSEKEQPEQDRAVEECAVYVSGEVKKPGIYRYFGTARLCDAVKARGGFTKKADRNSVNLARILVDGEQIIVPNRKKAKNSSSAVAAESEESSREHALTDINKASLEELMTLPGIGETKAEAIIAYRTEHGPFTKTEDLMKISGIKEGVYNKMKSFIMIT